MTEDDVRRAAESDPDNPPRSPEFWRDAWWVAPDDTRLVRVALDPDVAAWFKADAAGRSRLVNDYLRKRMNDETP